MNAAFDSEMRAKERMRLDDYARSWLLGKIPTLKASTRRTYADALDDHILPVLGRLYLDAITPEDVRQWFAAKTNSYAPATANCFLRVLKTMMADASAEHALRNPTTRVKAVPKERSRRTKKHNMLSADEMRLFLDKLQELYPQWHALVFTQFATATRFGEVSALRWEDIDEDRGVIVVCRSHWRTRIDTTKTDDERVVILTTELHEILRAWRQHLLRSQHKHLHSGWVFPSRVGKPHHSPSCMRKAFADVLTRIEVAQKFSSHGLRRTANDLLRRVASGEVTRAITGHATVAMTDHYSYVDLDEKKVATSNMLRLVRGEEDDDEAAN